ncbi:MAG: hypothetical protein H6618_03730 [Deltaproteobacteria bacterium]|nr:hypothetical protein [Deltaproteobacteria bacterium]
MITNLYWAQRNGEDHLKYARIQDPLTKEVRLAEAHELEDPDNAEVGDEHPYKVSILSRNLSGQEQTHSPAYKNIL